MIYSNFIIPFWYTPLAERDELSPGRFLLKPINYRTYSLMTNNIELPDGVTFPTLHEIILDSVIIDSENIDLVDSKWSEVIPLELKQELIEVLIESSIPKDTFYDSLAITVELAISPTFSDKSWDCTHCQSRKLDRSRNCPFLDEEDYDPMFTLNILGETYSKCPMNLQDKKLLKGAFDAYHMKTDGNGLPEVGSVGDQTVFYAVCSSFVDRAIKREEARQMEAARPK